MSTTCEIREIDGLPYLFQTTVDDNGNTTTTKHIFSTANDENDDDEYDDEGNYIQTKSANGNLCHDCDKITKEGRWDDVYAEDMSWYCADCCKVHDDAAIKELEDD